MNETMKVAYYTGDLDRGGLETLMLDVCRKHDETPFDMVLLYRHNGSMTEAFKQSGVTVIHVPKNQGIIRHLWNLRHVILHEKVDVIHSQSAIGTMLVSVALIGAGVKIVTTFHGNLFTKTSWWRRKLVCSASKKIICVSGYQKQCYEKSWKLPKQNKLMVVYNGIDFSKITSAKPLAEFPKRDAIRLAMVGNFIRGRSQFVVVQALHRILTQHPDLPNFDFYFVGYRAADDHTRYDQCVQYCKKYHLDNIHFLGSRDDVPSILKSMDGFVYSTAHDTFGIAVIEAIAAELPIVVNDWPVMTEVCDLALPDSNKAIRFFRTEDVVDCANKMVELIKDVSDSDSSISIDCQQAAAQAMNKYSINNHIKQLYSIYQSI